MSTTAERPRAKSLNPLLALLPFLRPYRAMMVGAFFALLIAAGAQLALPVALRQLIDHVFAEKDFGTINKWFLGFPGRGGDFRRVCRPAFLHGDLGGRAGGRGFAQRPSTGAWCAWTPCSTRPRGSARCCRG